MNTKNKLLLLSIVLFAGFLYLAYNILVSVNTINIYHKTQTKIEKLNTELLTLRRNEKDFLLRKDEKYITKHSSNFEQLLNDINLLQEQLNLLEIPFGAKIDLVVFDFKTYQDEFIKLTQAYKKQGYTKEDGLLEKIERNKIDIQKSIDNIESSVYKKYSQLLQMTYGIIHSDRMENRELLEKQLKSLKEISKNKKLVSLLEKYHINLLAFMENKTKIGLDENDGLRGSMRSAIHSAENSLKNISLEIEYLLENQQTEFINNFTIKIVLILVLILVFSLLVYGSINKDLVQLAKSEQKNKELNDELLEINSHLEEKVERGIQKNLQQEIQLFESAKLVAMGSMIGNIIHQWKQPLSAISITASALYIKTETNMKVTSNEIMQDMESIINSVNRLNAVTQTFRNFLKEKKESKEIDLEERIEDSLVISGTVLNDKGIKLIKNIELDEKIIIKTIPNELTEVIVNIINNAVDIIEEKEIKDGQVIVSLSKNETMAIISIEDNGGGIPDEVMPHIFEEYYTTKDDNRGTGLGLYMSHKIVCDSLQGKIYAKNSDNGAKFFIELPLS